MATFMARDTLTTEQSRWQVSSQARSPESLDDSGDIHKF